MAVPVNRVLVKIGAIINILPASMFKRLNKQEHDSIPTEITINNFMGGITRIKGIILVQLTIRKELRNITINKNWILFRVHCCSSRGSRSSFWIIEPSQIVSF